MKIINEISLGVWFETNEDTWIIPRVKLMSMCIKGVNVAQATKDPKVRYITWMTIKLFIR